MLEIGFTSHQHYISKYLSSFFRSHGIEANITQSDAAVTLEADENDPALQAALEQLNKEMPYSLFMQSVSHRITAQPFSLLKQEIPSPIPLNLGLCNRCRSEMLDPAGRRYYYPFTACSHCGPHYAFFEHYPYTRENTAFRFIAPCKACEEELRSNPFRQNFAQISCNDCNVSLMIKSNGEIKRADAAAQYKAFFDLAAKEIERGKAVTVKTTFGYRRFTLAASDNITRASRLLYINSRTIMDNLSLSKQEIESLFSLEKPLLKVATRSEALKELFGTAVMCKVPDEAFTILLCDALKEYDPDYIVYEECDAPSDETLLLGFDLPFTTQSDMQLFVNAQERLIRSGERVSYPAQVTAAIDTLSISDGLVAVHSGNIHTIDRMEHFDRATASRVNLLEGCDEDIGHSNMHRFTVAEGALMSALASHNLSGSAVGVFFEGETIEFHYYNGSHVTTVVPAMAFEAEHLIEKLSGLREGSDRLVANIRQNIPELYGVLKMIENDRLSLFSAAAAIVGPGNGGFDALDNIALTFMGKGGTQVETKHKDTRFDPYAFLASILSYKIAEVEPSMLAYSIFESLGDYFADILMQLKSKSKAEHIVLCGEKIAQSSLYSRIMEKMNAPKPLTNRSFPINRDGAVVGGIYL